MPRQRTVDATLEPYREELGKVADQQIADRAGVSRAAVVNFRKRLGIEAYEGYKFVAGGGRATNPDEPVKRGRGRPRKEASAESAAPKPERRKPGRKPRAAAQVAAPAAAPKSAAAESTPEAGGFRGRKSALEPYVHLLGKMSDKEISTLANVSTENVRAYRMRRGIASARASRKEDAEVASPVVAPAAVEAVAVVTPAAPVRTVSAPAARSVTAQGMTAYAVAWSADGGTSGTYVVLAADMRAAAGAAEAGLAQRHPGATLQSLARVAEVLG